MGYFRSRKETGNLELYKIFNAFFSRYTDFCLYILQSKMMMDKRKIYKKLMVIGRATGCHQLPERSFSFRGKQFPVCARCTGVFIGEVLGIFLFKVGEISNIIAVVFSLIMFADWFVQYKFHYESNNIRRLITGLLCGYAFGNIIMKYLRYFM